MPTRLDPLGFSREDKNLASLDILAVSQHPEMRLPERLHKFVMQSYSGRVQDFERTSETRKPESYVLQTEARDSMTQTLLEGYSTLPTDLPVWLFNELRPADVGGLTMITFRVLPKAYHPNAPYQTAIGAALPVECCARACSRILSCLAPSIDCCAFLEMKFKGRS